MEELEQNVQIFNNEEFGKIRVLTLNNEPWFVGKDVAEKLGYKNGNRDITTHIDEEDRIMLDKTQYQNGIKFDYRELGQRGGWIINESGLYSLILSSKLPNAKKFKKWVTNEVLPSIRKHGAYMTEDTIQKALTNPDFLIQLATQLKEEQEKRKLLEEEKKINAPKVVFADAVNTSITSISINDLAKLIKQNSIDIGGKRLFEWLRQNGYLIKRKGTDYNTPTQKAMELGLFEVKETVIRRFDNTTSIKKTPKVTGKGQQYFINKFLKEKEGNKKC